MSIQFPPVNPGDTLPRDGDTYTYVPTQTEYIYNQTENSWSVVTDSGGVPLPITIGKILRAGEGTLPSDPT